MSNPNDYWVALRYTAKAGGHHGVITATCYSSEQVFDEFYASDEGKESLTRSEIVEQGITQERAIELAKSTPAACRIAAAFESAINPKTRLVNYEILSHELEKAVFAITHSGL